LISEKISMSLTSVIILIIIGLVAGTFSGMIGLGGAIIIIPALIYFLGMNQLQAQGTSLAVMLPPIGMLAAWNYFKAGHLNISYALIIAASFIIGGYLGSKVVLDLPVHIVKKAFGFVLLIISIHILFSSR